MTNINETYHRIVRNVLDNGVVYNDPKRKGVTRKQVKRMILEHDLTANFPAISTKKLAWNAVVTELIWFLQGDTNIKYLRDNGVNIWDKDAYAHYQRLCETHAVHTESMQEWLKNVDAGMSSVEMTYVYGDVGPIYGSQWREFQGPYSEVYDQIAVLLHDMRETPMSTELLVSAWNPTLLHRMALPPCHFEFQILMEPLTETHRYHEFKKRNAGKMIQSKMYDNKDFDAMNIPKYGFELVWTQRSTDVFLGLPFNIASYALLAHIIGLMTNTVPMKLSADLRNVHLYGNSLYGATEQLKRDVNKHKPTQLLMKDKLYTLAEDTLVPGDHILRSLTPDMFKLYKYTSDPAIVAPMLPRD